MATKHELTNEEKIAQKRAKRERKKALWGEFKSFITRGNIIDMSIGIIIGGAFTAIVTALTNNIFKPLINALLIVITGSKSLEGIYTYLIKVETADGKIDLTNSVYIDWGAFINSLINFLLVALILFLIVKLIAFLIKKKKALEELATEEYYKKHPEMRPAPVEEEAPKPTTEELLSAILTEIKKDKDNK